MYIKQILPMFHQVPPIFHQVPPIIQLVTPIPHQVPPIHHSPESSTNFPASSTNSPASFTNFIASKWFSPIIHQLFALLHARPSNPRCEILIFALLPFVNINWTLYTELHDVYYINYTFIKLIKVKLLHGNVVAMMSWCHSTLTFVTPLQKII